MSPVKAVTNFCSKVMVGECEVYRVGGIPAGASHDPFGKGARMIPSSRAGMPLTKACTTPVAYWGPRSLAKIPYALA